MQNEIMDKSKVKIREKSETSFYTNIASETRWVILVLDELNGV